MNINKKLIEELEKIYNMKQEEVFLSEDAGRVIDRIIQFIIIIYYFFLFLFFMYIIIIKKGGDIYMPSIIETKKEKLRSLLSSVFVDVEKIGIEEYKKKLKKIQNELSEEIKEIERIKHNLKNLKQEYEQVYNVIENLRLLIN